MQSIRHSFDAADLCRAIEGTGVTTTVLVQVLNDAGETAGLLDIARAIPQIAGVVAWADLTRTDLDEQLDELRRRGPLVGIRHQLQAEPSPAQWLSRSQVRSGLATLAAHNLPFELMIQPAQFDAAVDVVRANPGAVFVLDHLGKPPIASGALEPWAAGLQRMAELPNVTSKLSGLVTMADHRRWQVSDLEQCVDVALGAFGSSRLMFGSDWPVCLLAAGYPRLVAAMETMLAGLSAAERDDIWSSTARRVYSLA